MTTNASVHLDTSFEPHIHLHRIRIRRIPNHEMDKNKGRAAGNSEHHACAAAAAATKHTEQETTKRRVNKLSTNVMKNALVHSPFLRVADDEMGDPRADRSRIPLGKGRESLTRRVEALLVSGGFRKIPSKNAMKYYTNDKKYTLHVVTFKWVNEAREDVFIQRCKIAHFSVPQPETTPIGEHVSLVCSIRRRKRNKLFLVKNVDAQGDFTACHFAGFDMSTLIVSPKLLLYTRN